MDAGLPRWGRPVTRCSSCGRALTDFLVYWRHRAEHKLFWPIHAVHHSPTELHAANDIGHPMQVWFSIVFIAIPISLVQIDGPATPLAVGFVLQLLTYYIHSPMTCTSGHYAKCWWTTGSIASTTRWSRGISIRISASASAIWDRWFGTAYDPAPDEWPQSGLADVEPPRTIRDYLLLPFRLGPGQQDEHGQTRCAI